jgi:hypothetical protein
MNESDYLPFLHRFPAGAFSTLIWLPSEDSTRLFAFALAPHRKVGLRLWHPVLCRDGQSLILSTMVPGGQIEVGHDEENAINVKTEDRAI